MISVKFSVVSTDVQGTKWRRKIVRNFKRLGRVHERYRQTDRQTDERATAYSCFAKNLDAQKKRSGRKVRGVSPETERESMVGKICERGRS